MCRLILAVFDAVLPLLKQRPRCLWRGILLSTKRDREIGVWRLERTDCPVSGVDPLKRIA